MSPDRAVVQITEEGILIPRELLPKTEDTENIEIILTADYVILRVRRPEAERGSFPYPFIGIGETRSPTASTEAEDILEKEVKPRSGWSLDR